MQINGRFLKVWKKEEQNGFTKLDIGDSKKLKDGKYENFTWFGCTLVGGAKAVEVSEGDTVEIKSGLITKRKYNEKWYDDIVIFDIEVTKKGEKTTPEAVDEFVPVDSESDLPF